MGKRAVEADAAQLCTGLIGQGSLSVCKDRAGHRFLRIFPARADRELGQLRPAGRLRLGRRGRGSLRGGRQVEVARPDVDFSGGNDDGHVRTCALHLRLRIEYGLQFGRILILGERRWLAGRENGPPGAVLNDFERARLECDGLLADERVLDLERDLLAVRHVLRHRIGGRPIERKTLGIHPRILDLEAAALLDDEHALHGRFRCAAAVGARGNDGVSSRRVAEDRHVTGVEPAIHAHDLQELIRLGRRLETLAINRGRARRRPGDRHEQHGRRQHFRSHHFLTLDSSLDARSPYDMQHGAGNDRDQRAPPRETRAGRHLSHV